jgi:uncharacterized membrane protein (DUF4010 family)
MITMTELLKGEWLSNEGLGQLPEFLSALAIGLLIGLERERNPSAKGGLRTFAIIALAGAVSAVLANAMSSPSIIAVGLGAVALTLIAAYYHDHGRSDPGTGEQDPGTTTVAAAMVCYLLAVMALSGQVRLAVMLAIATTTLLYFKAELGGFARALERRDLISILQFAVVTFVVLPILPDSEFGPYAAFNPRQIWMMVVLISGVSLAGYVALRVVGREHGAMLLGFFGGLVSSTATTLAYARHAKNESATHSLSRTVIVTANLVVLLRLMVFAAVISPAVLPVFAPVFGCALLAGLLAFALTRRSRVGPTELTMPDIRNPAELRAALGFALLYALVLLLSSWLVDAIGSRGAYGVAVLSGLTDVDAITMSSLRLFDMGSLSAKQMTTAVVLALGANAVFKLGIVRVVGGASLFRRCAPTLIAVMAGAVAGLVLIS